MVDLGKAVVEHGCEFGLGADGDGDRIGAVDEEGRFIYPDRLIALLAEDLLKDEDELPEDAGDDEHLRIVYDVKCSMNVEQAILEAGGRPVMARTGHSFMKRVLASMPECKMAAEMSGHIFLADRGWYGFDCSLYNAARLIELWSRHAPSSEGGPTFSSELDRLAPSLPTTGEVKVPCPEERKLEVVAAITEAFADHECSVVDGVRVRFDNEDGEYVGWYLARKSNTEPVLVMRIEAADDDVLARIRSTVNERVANHVDISTLLSA
jgi:phosphomannomutase